MTEDEHREAFAEAFIAQARSDWGVQRLLSEQRDVAVCHRLHYLQMVCEKLDAPENVEYPWERNDRVTAPCSYSFPSIELQRDPGGRAFLNLIERALDDYESRSLS